MSQLLLADDTSLETSIRVSSRTYSDPGKVYEGRKLSPTCRDEGQGGPE